MDRAAGTISGVAVSHSLPTLTAPRVLFAACFGVLAIDPALRLRIGDASLLPTDIAPPQMALYAYAIPMALFAVMFIREVLAWVHIAYIAGGAISLLLMASFWHVEIAQWSALVHLLSAVLVWAVGAAFMTEESKRPDPLGYLMFVVLISVTLQATYCVLQLLGYVSVGSLTAEGTTITRVSGTVGHPGNFGKILFFLLVLTLPALVSPVRRTKRLALVSLVMIIGLVGLSFSRANFIAVLITLLAWIIVAPGQRASGRVIVMGVVALMSTPFIDGLIARFESDPEGGIRPLVWEAAMTQLEIEPWRGVGPNSFIASVGQWDAAVASGYPVHNAFVLAIAELGLVVGVLLFVPQLVLVIRSLLSWFRRERNVGAATMLAAAPGIFVIGWTGWGMLSTPYLQIWFISLGVIAAVYATSTKQNQPSRETILDRRTLVIG